jgi:hypothetical protein
MKKLMFAACISFFAFSCDAPNQSSEQGAGSESEERAPVDPAESGNSDNSSVHSDTTTTGDMNRQNAQYDTVQ